MKINRIRTEPTPLGAWTGYTVATPDAGCNDFRPISEYFLMFVN